jgi:hypothetical protein
MTVSRHSFRSMNQLRHSNGYRWGVRDFSLVLYTEQENVEWIPVSKSVSIVVKKYKRDGEQMYSIRKYIESKTYTGWTKEGIDFTPEQGKAILRGLKRELGDS